MSELQAAHKRMKKGKAPGNDGLSTDFYKLTWSFMRYDLLDTLNEVFLRKQLPISMTQSIVTLIYKNKGSDEDLKNYRPISLLNVDYKYMTSMLTARIEPLLAKLVDSDQGGGVKNRLIEDQLIMIQDIFDYYKDKKDRAMIEAQDLSSAFDFVSHQYLCEVLVAMNFSEAIINLVKAIYNNLYSAVTVNGAKTRYFRLT